MIEIGHTRKAPARPGVVLLVIVASLAAMAPLTPSAIAGPPSHSRLAVEDIEGLNHACGTATDSNGDIYVSSAGESLVKVYAPRSTTPLASIANGNEPCGLAVDSKGNVYVSEGATGNVVRYAPNAYPLSSNPTYGAAVTVDSSGEAEGIAVDPSDDRLFVAAGDHVATYDSAGNPGPSINGELAEATGVAATTSASGKTLYLAVADAATDELRLYSGPNLAGLEHRRTIAGVDHDLNPATAEQAFGFGEAGAALSAEPYGGHLFLYDAANEAVDEFEITGQFLDQTSDPGFEDAHPSAAASYPNRSEVQRITLDATRGEFTLGFEGETVAIEVSSGLGKPTGDEIEAALESMSAIGPGNVTVQGIYNGALIPPGSYAVGFVGDLGQRDVPSIEADGSGLSGGAETVTVTTETPGSGPGRLLVGAGAAAGARALAFAGLAPASRGPRPALSVQLKNATGVAVDSAGNRYVAAGNFVNVYPPTSSTPLAKIEDPEGPRQVGVDSAGRVYVLDGQGSAQNEGRVAYYTPSSFPPGPGVTYSGPTTVSLATDPVWESSAALSGMGLDPKTGEVFVQKPSRRVKYAAAGSGSEILDPNWGAGLGIAGEVSGSIGVHGETGNVYLIRNTTREIDVIDAAGEEILARIDGTGAPRGRFAEAPASIAVDQANGHVFALNPRRPVAEEFEPSGAYVTSFGRFKNVEKHSAIAVDNSGGPNDGVVYVAFFGEEEGGDFEGIHAYEQLSYGEAPLVTTGLAGEVGAGSATLHGTVNPNGFELEACRFEYLTETAYEESGETFAGATVVPCSQSLATIGNGNEPVPVSAQIGGLDLSQRYRFRLVAVNEFGTSAEEQEAGIFGPPQLEERGAKPVLYTEAALHAEIDPSGLATTYRVQYGTSESYGQETAPKQLSADAGPTEVTVHLSGLQEGTRYHFRFFVENEAGQVTGDDGTLVTAQRRTSPPCPNAEYRTGLSATLPDCRAYELVTPAGSRGLSPYFLSPVFSAWPTPPEGPEAGGSLAYFVNGTLPGFDGNGRTDGYRARRGPGDHPPEGWSSELFTPAFAQTNGADIAGGVLGNAADQRYAFFSFSDPKGEATLEDGAHLGTPAGFELLGKGSLGTDPGAVGRFLSDGGSHVIFSSKAHLEPEAPAAGTEAIYDRTANSSDAQVVSMTPGETPFGAGEDATYVGSSQDGSAVVFEVGGALYLRRDNAETLAIAAAPNTFAGISADGTRVFYAAAALPLAAPSPSADLFACDVDAGPCTGPGSHSPIEIAPAARFVNVSEGGTRVYFIATAVLDAAEEGVAGEENLYLWDEGEVGFVAVLDPSDLQSFEGLADVNLAKWPSAVASGAPEVPGRGHSPTRTTPDGSVLVFQSHAELTGYDSGGHGEIFRYEAAAEPGERLICVSCNPSGIDASADASLGSLLPDSPLAYAQLLSNVTAAGRSVVFESLDRLLPQDVNSARDVYEWQARGVEGCTRPDGCLALVSSGQSESDSFLYAMTLDGHDIFLRTSEELLGADVPGTVSIYDARVGGGIAEAIPPEPCHGEPCHGPASRAPSVPTPGVGGPGPGDVKVKKRRCRKGKRRVRRLGRVVCVKRHRRSQHRRLS